VRVFPRPSDKQGLQRFLGTVNFYRRFLPGTAAVLRPLTEALKGPGGKKRPLRWTKEMETGFCRIKELLCSATTLAHPEPAAAISLSVDASDTHVGAVLQQGVGAARRPLAFYSKKLDSAQPHYSAFDRELLAAFLAVRHFRFSLEGRRFILYTNHKTADVCFEEGSGPLDGQAAAAASIFSGVYVRHPPRRRRQQRGSGHTVEARCWRGRSRGRPN
jgi:RNase H-like domain found in reverse transcriptase